MENIIINVGRQLGSGGREIGERIAQRLGIAFYDKQLLRLASEESGVSHHFFEHADERQQFSLKGLFCVRAGMMQGTMGYGSYLDNDSLFQIQSNVIRKLAEKESCVFMGRCADYIFRDHPRTVNLFISSTYEDRLARLVRRHPEYTVEQITDYLQKADKRRAAYYNYYTNKQWGMAQSYDLCINSSILGIEATTDYLMQFITCKLHLDKDAVK